MNSGDGKCRDITKKIWKLSPEQAASSVAERNAAAAIAAELVDRCCPLTIKKNFTLDISYNDGSSDMVETLDFDRDYTFYGAANLCSFLSSKSSIFNFTVIGLNSEGKKDEDTGKCEITKVGRYITITNSLIMIFTVLGLLRPQRRHQR